MTTKKHPPISRAQMRAFCTEAAAAGDTEAVAIARRAIDDSDPDAMREVAQMIRAAAAAAMADDA